MSDEIAETDDRCLLCLDLQLSGACYCPSHRNNRHIADDGSLMVRHENGWRKANPGERHFFNCSAEERY